MIKKNLVLAFIFLILIAIPLSLAHTETNTEEEIKLDKFKEIKSSSLTYVAIASIISLLAIVLSFFHKHKSQKAKVILFLLIILPILVSTIYLLWATLYTNINSETKGPVHYHADFEIWNCNELVNLKDPIGILNRIGSPIFHEHNDNRIHVEGAVIKKSTIDLHSFFEIIGGEYTKDKLSIPTNQGTLNINSKGFCNNNPAELQVFLYKITNPANNRKTGFLFEQTKLENPQDYIMSPYQNIPPGDCIIIEFSEPKEKTEKICETYKVAIQNGDLTEI